MKKQIFKSIFLFSILYFAFCIHSNAQIVYTDVIPDITKNTNGAVYPLDLNNDGTFDYDISIFSNGPCLHCSARIQLTPTAGNYEVIISAHPSALIFGTSINNLTMVSSSSLYMASSGWLPPHMGNNQWTHITTGNWLNKTNCYLGLKFLSSGNYYYGWARLDSHVNSNGTASFTIKDYAYNSIPNQSILAGDSGNTATEIHENISSNHFSIYSFNKAINIKLNDAFTLQGNITICNTLGQDLKCIKIENRTMQIDMSNCSSGIYSVTVQTNEAVETKKIYLK